ncbi:MAG: ABC transporter permease, partial [Planctomycetota bacterium]
MYKLLLTFKYLRRRLIPLFALLSVMLCCAMVVTILGVMGGVLDALRQTTRIFIGDVLISSPVPIPRYEQLIRNIEQHPDALAATPIIPAYGLIKTPNGSTKTVMTFGIEPESFSRITQYTRTLYWKPERLAEHNLAELRGSADPIEAALSLSLPTPDGRTRPAMVLGIDLNPGNEHQPDGSYTHTDPAVGRSLTLTILSSPQFGADPTPETAHLPVVNEFNSGLYEFDSQFVFAPFAVIQRMMKMDAQPAGDDRPATLPGAKEIHIKAAPGVSPERLRQTVYGIYDQLRREHEPSDNPLPLGPRVETWSERFSGILNTIEGQKRLVTSLFVAVSGVAVLLILVMFYMIVMEKTRDIGILRSIGASRAGVAGIYLAFGAALGAIGAALGIALGLVLVYNINAVHAMLGDVFGFQIWDRSIYFFHEIPARVLPTEAIGVIVVAIL